MKHLIFIVAYNHENFIAKVLDRLPKTIKNNNYEILVIDDASKDETFKTAINWSNLNSEINIKVLKNPTNLGYGGNQKLGFQYAIENNFNTLALLHGDGQYAPEIIVDLIEEHLKQNNALTLGSRMMIKTNALKGKMPLYKFFGNIILTFLQNKILGTKLSEFHTGYRIYSIKDIKVTNFHLNTNDYHFDTEIIIQFILHNFKIGEYAIPTYYGDEISYVNGLKYAFNILKETVKFKLQKFSIFYDKKYELQTSELYYDKSNFYSTHSVTCELIKNNSNVVDLGSSEGKYLNKLKEKGCFIKTVNVKKNKNFLRFDKHENIDLNKYLPKDLNKYEYILILDVIEHLYNPENFIERLSKEITDKQTVIVSTGNIAFIFVRIMLLLGFFNYGKRGILDITHTRLFNFSTFKSLFLSYNFTISKSVGIPVPIPFIFGENFFSKILLHLNKLLIKILPGLFSYQILLTLKPSLTLNKMLDNTVKHSKY